jgi:hypothetical protein
VLIKTADNASGSQPKAIEGPFNKGVYKFYREPYFIESNIKIPHR